MTEEHIRTVEINGIKMEIDTRTAKRIDTYRVGDPVKVLVKRYGDSFSIMPGIIIDFVEFEKRPTISVAYIEGEELKVLSINEDTKDTEIAPTNVLELAVNEDDMLERIDRKIGAKQRELEDAIKMKELIKQRFKVYFEANAEMAGKGLQ